jgi:hypothetical protein
VKEKIVMKRAIIVFALTFSAAASLIMEAQSQNDPKLTEV